MLQSLSSHAGQLFHPSAKSSPADSQGRQTLGGWGEISKTLQMTPTHPHQQRKTMFHITGFALSVGPFPHCHSLTVKHSLHISYSCDIMAGCLYIIGAVLQFARSVLQTCLWLHCSISPLALQLVLRCLKCCYDSHAILLRSIHAI